MNVESKAKPPGVLSIAPLFPAAAGVVIGISVDHHLACGVFGYAATLTAATIASCAGRIRRRLGVAIVMLAAVGAGGLLHWASCRVVAASSIEHHADRAGAIVRVRGTIVLQPRLLDPPENPFAGWAQRTRRTAFILAVESIEGEQKTVAASGKLRVTVFEPVLDLREGERVEVFGRLYSLRSPDNPGSFDWEAYYRRQGVVARMNCKHREAVRRLEVDGSDGLSGVLAWFRATATELLIDEPVLSGEPRGGLLEAMILGRRSRLGRDLNEVFIRAGCIHFLAVSGVHIVIVMFFARLAVRILGGGSRASVLAMMLAAVFYVLVAEPRPPILRAGVIVMIYCIACLVHRERACLNWVSAAVIVLAIYSPSMVFDVGYQLSTAAVLGVSFLAPALRDIAALLVEWLWPGRVNAVTATGARPPHRLHRPWRWSRWKLTQGLSITCAAWLASLPIVAAYFFRIHPWGAINSLLVLPFVTLVMGLGFAKLLAGLVSPVLGAAIALPLEACDRLLVGFVDRLSSLPGSAVAVSSPPVWLIALYYGFLIALTLRHRRRQPAELESADRGGSMAIPIRRPPKSVLIASAVCFLVGLVVWLWPAARTNRLVLTVLSVGRGTAVVIEVPDGETVLYDAGTSFASDVGRSTVVPFLLHSGITTIDRVFVSHPNVDHFGGIPSIIDALPTGPVTINRFFVKRSRPKSESERLLRMLGERGHPTETLGSAPATWDLGGATVELLWPTDDLGDAYTTNDTSTVLRVSYKGRSVLLTGDIQALAQEALITRGRISADVLVLPHHGGVGRTTESFVRAVDPSVVVRSSSEPNAQTLNGLLEIITGYRLYNTADHGAIRIVIDDTGVSVRTTRDRSG